MRISVDPTDIGFIEDTTDIVVKFNDKLIFNAITSDEELGYVKCYDLDSFHKYELNEVPIKELYGKVQIIIKENNNV